MATEAPARPSSSALTLLWVALALWTALALAVGLLPPGLDVRLAALATMLALTLLAAGASAALAARRSRGGDRRLWGVLAVAFTVFGFAMLPWLVPGRGGAGTWATPGTTASPLETAFAVGAVLGWGALFGWTVLKVAPVARADDARRWQWLFDALLGLGALFILDWYVLAAFGPLVAATPLERAVGALVIAVALLLVIASSSAAWALRRGPTSRFALVAGSAVLSAGLLLWPWWFQSRSGTGEPFMADLVEVIWLFAAGTIAVAGRYRSQEPPETPWVVSDRQTGPLRVLAVAAASAIVTLVVGVTGWIALGSSLPPDTRRFAMVAGLMLVAGTVARGALSTIDSEGVVAQLRVDPLTGLFNVRHFGERLAEEVAVARQIGEPLSIASVDLDDFAGVNVTCGPAAADRTLSEIGAALRDQQGPDLLVARTGGDEFGLLMVGSDEAAAAQRVHEIIRVIAAAGVPSCRTTASAGVAGLRDGDLEPGDLVERADRALYWAKYRGKDAVATWSPRLMGARFERERPRLAERRALMTLVRSLAAVNDGREPTRHGHSRKVADLAATLARAAGLDEEQVSAVEAAALLHDIGIVCVPDEVLGRPGPLEPQERDLLEQHPEVGARIVSGTELHEVAPWIAAHHERWDGTGYPMGLAGEAIPYEARVIRICDAFDGTTSGRPHHGPRDWRDGVAVISEGMGSDFDPALAERFIGLMVSRGGAS
jgi:two-component system cell cycle response regulator